MIEPLNTKKACWGCPARLLYPFCAALWFTFAAEESKLFTDFARRQLAHPILAAIRGLYNNRLAIFRHAVDRGRIGETRFGLFTRRRLAHRLILPGAHSPRKNAHSSQTLPSEKTHIPASPAASVTILSVPPLSPQFFEAGFGKPALGKSGRIHAAQKVVTKNSRTTIENRRFINSPLILFFCMDDQ